jgi:hypothetical protein
MGFVFQAFRLPRLHLMSEIVPAFPAVLTAIIGAEPKPKWAAGSRPGIPFR